MTKRMFILALMVPLLVACNTTPERPTAFKYTYKSVADMTPEQFQKAQQNIGRTELGKRFMWVDEQKFLNGDAVEYKVGTLTVMAKYLPLLRVGHFTFVNDPKGLEGEVTTTTYVVGATKEGLVARNDNTGKMTVLTKDIGRAPDVGRLIISKAADIMSALGQNFGAAKVRADAACKGDCGGSPTAIAISDAFAKGVGSGSAVVGACETDDCGGKF